MRERGRKERKKRFLRKIRKNKIKRFFYFVKILSFLRLRLMGNFVKNL